MLRVDLDIVQRWIAPGSRVLDLGCGDGTLLEVLRGSRGIEGYGIEIDAAKITQCIARGINVIEADLDRGLADFPDKSFDAVLMTNSLQALRRPDRTIAEMLRIGRECVVTFPNFGNIRTRAALVAKGQNITLEEHIARTGAPIPLGRMGRAEEFANIACFLASDEGGYITGTATNVDGGASPVV